MWLEGIPDVGQEEFRQKSEHYEYADIERKADKSDLPWAKEYAMRALAKEFRDPQELGRNLHGDWSGSGRSGGWLSG